MANTHSTTVVDTTERQRSWIDRSRPIGKFLLVDTYMYRVRLQNENLDNSKTAVSVRNRVEASGAPFFGISPIAGESQHH
jgi:hypothetical protein